MESVSVALREKLSRQYHKLWSGWMEYLFSVSKHNRDGSVTIPVWAVERWRRQSRTTYADLSEDEKDEFRRQSDKFT